MRKFITYILVFITILSCVKESEGNEIGLVKSFDAFSILLETALPDSKASISPNGTVKWDAYDRVGLYSDSQSPVSYSRWPDGLLHGDVISGTTFYAYYPFGYGCNVQYDEKNVDVLKCGGFQASVSDSLGTISFPMVAKSKDNHLVFKQVCGVLHFRVKVPSGSRFRVFLKGNMKEQLSGSGTISIHDDIPVHTFISGSGDAGYTMSTFFINQTSDVEPNVWHIYYPIPEMTLSRGFTLEVYLESENDEPKYYEKVYDKPLEIKRGIMKSFSVFDTIKEEIEQEIAIQNDRATLVAIYDSLNGDDWSDNTNWCSDKPLSEWKGITVNEKGRVTSIVFGNNNMVGIIPDEIGNLSELVALRLGAKTDADPTGIKNTIEGDISCLGKLAKLERLELIGAGLSGPFPEVIRDIPSLTFINLSENSFSGQLPLWLGEFTNLWHIDLSSNHFSGEVKNLFINMTNLNELNLQDNQFEGALPNLPNSTNLRYAWLSLNSFSGSFPESYAQIMDHVNDRAYPHLFASLNKLSGELPPAILNHTYFPEFVWNFIPKQQPGYMINLDAIPASRNTFDTFDGGKFNLGNAYQNSNYTLIVRWAEWCINSIYRIPELVKLARKYEGKGLQTIWAYAGGEEQDRIEYMRQTGLDQFSNHIVECYEKDVFTMGKDRAFWLPEFYQVPLVELVNRNGNILFIQDDLDLFTSYQISHSINQLPAFLYGLMEDENDLYSSSDYSANGTTHLLQAAQIGNGINVILMGDAYSDRLIADGTYDSAMRRAMNALFSEEPFNSYKEYFNVYYVDIVSKNEVFYGETALETYYGEGTDVGGRNQLVLNYARTVLSEDQMDDALVIVLMNRDYYAGTCNMFSIADGDYGRGLSISYFPTSSIESTFCGMVSHEAGGHGFAKLADEYAYESYGAVPQWEIDHYSSNFPYGWWRNADFTGDPTQVKWSQFISDPRYEAENIGTYEGAFTYWTGAWRPTEDSIMNQNAGGFNAPSRYAIWYRINKLAYGPEWQGTYEDFVEFDKPNRTAEAISKRKATRRNFVEKDFVPLAPPVIIEGDWRNLAKH